jgi:hypothetical protein
VGIRAHGELNDNLLKQRSAARWLGARPDKITTREISNGEWMPNVIDSDQDHFPLRTGVVANSPRAVSLQYLHMCQKCHALTQDEAL